MLSHELRRAYIDFFVEQKHLHLPSAPVVPVDALGEEDRSTLFTSAGMQQFKPFFTGQATPPSPRIVTVQKCVRTGDIESVGDYSHCTFFEMLGNFSFGDYFKHEVICWTWEFLTQRLGLDADRLCATVFMDDDEAYSIWRNEVGLPADRVHRLGADKNFWPANAIADGPNGPCGPCTEVFYRVAPESAMTTDPAMTPAERYKVDDSAGRWLEIWNNVFTQFDRREAGDEAVLAPLPAKNNDTGAGFERIVGVLQGVGSVFETDLFRPIVQSVVDLAGRPYGGSMDPLDVAYRVVAEHTRTMTFCIADGVLPSNEGRGYVLRRIMRRAIRYGKSVLGFDRPFLAEVAPAVIAKMGADHPELALRADHIIQTIGAEEERFLRTLDNGMRRLFDILETPAVKEAGVIKGDDAFMLYDTFGFPLELTQEIASEASVDVDRAGFGRAMEEQRRRSQEGSDLETKLFGDMGAALSDVQRTVAATRFEGYHSTSLAGARVQAILRDGAIVTSLSAGLEAEVVLDRTSFYAESGGQVGDLGALEAPDLVAKVTEVRKVGGLFIHKVVVESGLLAAGAEVNCVVDAARRLAIARNHTATHLLQAALREVLGSHVHQKGSLVAADRLRFDFTHGAPVSAQELRMVEDLVNARVLDDLPVAVMSEVPIADARAAGAMALFGEKYGEFVRMVTVPGVSVELCGGTHLERTSQAGLVKVVSETGVAAGVRRIEALTGAGTLAYYREREEQLEHIARVLKTSSRDVLGAAEKLATTRSELEKQVQKLRTRSSDQPDASVVRVAGITLVVAKAEGSDPATIGALADQLAGVHKPAVVVVGGAGDGKVLFAVKAAPEAVKAGAHAGNLIREIARIAGGGGGGRPDFAQAGGRDPGKLASALEAAGGLLEGQLAAH